MNHNLQIFKYNDVDVRTVVRDGNPWWVLKDVCDVLEIDNPRNVAARLDDDEKGVHNTDTPGGQQEMTIVSESGLYSAILLSRKPEAKAFKRWITHEVLPSIRKHGMYATDATIDKIIADPEYGIKLLTALRDEQDKNKALQSDNSRLIEENDKQKQTIGELKPAKDYVDYILSSPGTMAISQIAADYNMSAQRLNKVLWEENVQHLVNSQWILYASYMGRGFTRSETIHFCRSDGRPDTKLLTKWTQKGRLFINAVLNRRGIFANMDIAGTELAA